VNPRMKCPDCGARLTTKHYDATYEWYECPKCEGVFTFDEIIEGGQDESSEPEEAKGKGDRRRSQSSKAGRSRGAQRTNAGRANGKASAGDAEIRERLTRTASGVAAKGKKRRTEIAEDEEVIAEHEKQMMKPRASTEPKVVHHRDEVESREVVSILADEIQDVYHELGYELDDANSRDKALIMWREIRYTLGATARERAVPHAACKDHS